ncbi:MAG: TonB-dependent receptor plug domain-containing protein [Steroidobacteraceae bacterium]
MIRTLLGSTGLVLSIGLAPGAYAQGAADEGLQLEEIVVTAEKREVNLQKTPISIQVYSGDELKKQGKNRIDEIMNGVVGVTTQTDVSGAMIFNFRGLNTGLAAAPGTPNPGGVALVIDGITQDRSDALRGGTLDVAQVEVARGTQNSNLGAGSFAGAISLVSNAPALGVYQASGTLELGNYNKLNIQGVLNMPVTDNQALRVAFSSERRDGYVTSNAGDSDLRSARVRYRWKASDDLDIILTANNQKISGQGVSDGGGLLYTGHFIPYSGQAVYSPVTGQTYQPGQIYTQTPATFTFAAGSVLGPGRTPLAATTTLSFNQPCTTATPSLFTSATAPNAPFVATRGCPANYLALRDNTSYFDRSNPWDDGFPKYGWRDLPYWETTINNFSADIDWTTAIGTLTFAPGLQHTKEDSNERGPPNSLTARTQDTWQLEARLASLPSSKLIWQGGLYYHYSTGFRGTRVAYSLPTAAPPTLGMGGTTQTSTTVVPTLLNSCYVFNETTCTVLANNSGKNARHEASLYGNFTWPVIDTLRVIGGARYTKAKSFTDNVANLNNFISGDLDPATAGGFVFTGPAGTNCATATAANACLVSYVTYPPELLHQNVITQSWNGQFKIYNAATGQTIYTKARSGEFQFSAGVEYDLTEEAMTYVAYRTASQPPTVAAPSFVPSLPLELKQITVGLKSRWFDRRLQANIEAWDSKITGRTAASVLGTNYTITPATGTTFTCPTSDALKATAVLGPTGTSADSCFNQPLTANNTADVVSRGADLEINFLPTAADRIDLTVEYLPTSKLTAIKGAESITAADVLAAAAANPTSTSTGTAAQQQADAEAIAAAFNAQQSAALGGILQQSPKWSIDASYSHAFRLPNGSRFTPRLNMVYKSAYWTRPSGPPGSNADITNSTIAIKNGLFWPIVQPSYKLWNAYAGWDSADGKWSVNGYVTNIRKTPVMLNGSPTVAPITGTVAAPGNVQVVGGTVVLGAPRVLGVSLSANF